MSQTVLTPRPPTALPRRIPGFVVALIAVVVALVVAIAVFAWTALGDAEPATPTLPPVQAEPAATDARTLSADGPIVLDECAPRVNCRG